MERLKERSFLPGSLEAEASELLRGTSPHVAPSGLKRRVRERLFERRFKRWLPVLLRPALLAACSLLAVGALAAVGSAMLHALDQPAQVVPVVAPSTSVSSRPSGRARSAAPAIAIPAPSIGLDSKHERVATLVPPERSEARRGAPDRGEHGVEASPPSEAALVYGAAKALRNSADAALAAKLLDEHARRYPRGALAEEALALSIDVSMARGDGRAQQLAARYLERYPRGHFRAKAGRVVGP